MSRMRRAAALLVLCLLIAGCGKQPVAVETTETQESVIAETTFEMTVPETESSPAQEETEALKEELPPVITEIDHYVIKADINTWLTDEEKELYRGAVDAMMNREESFYVKDDYDVTLRVNYALSYNPYHFLVSKVAINDKHNTLVFSYDYSPEEQREMIDTVDREYLELINGNVTADMNDLEKTLAIYRYFATRIEYNYDWVEALNMSDEKYLFPDIAIYEALTTNRGVCHSYTYLCEFALQQLGIECIPLSGDMTNSDDGHMWLCVKLGDHFYHVDPTSDRGDTTCSLYYFGQTDSERQTEGISDNYSISKDSAYDCTCDDERFDVFRDVIDYKLLGEHKILLVREDGSSEIMDLSDFI